MTMESPKAALVTGAAKRLGRCIALALAREGWDIALHYGHSFEQAQTTAQEIRALGRRCALLQADLADPSAVTALFAKSIEALGSVQVVVNSASRFEQDRPETFSAQALTEHLMPNVAAPLLLAQALHAHLKQSETRGVVVNLLDQKLWNLNPDFFSYTLAKSALHSATTMMAQALAPLVRVVGVAPGLTMISHLQTDAEFEKAQTISPIGRSSQPEDVAATVLFVVNNQALTGTSILVDGGQHLIPMQRDFSFFGQPL